MKPLCSSLPWLLLLLSTCASLIAAREGTSGHGGDDDSDAIRMPVINDKTGLRALQEENATLVTVDETCPPCPECNSNSTKDPLVLQVLVVDSRGILDMGTYIRLARVLPCETTVFINRSAGARFERLIVSDTRLENTTAMGLLCDVADGGLHIECCC